jgi:hypothetical protein
MLRTVTFSGTTPSGSSISKKRKFEEDPPLTKKLILGDGDKPDQSTFQRHVSFADEGRTQQHAETGHKKLSETKDGTALKKGSGWFA